MLSPFNVRGVFPKVAGPGPYPGVTLPSESQFGITRKLSQLHFKATHIAFYSFSLGVLAYLVDL